MSSQVSLMENVSSMNDEQLQVMMNKIMQAQISRQDRKLMEMQEDVEILKEKINISTELTQAQLELERKKHRVTESRYGFVSASDLGQKFQVSIGSITIGKLLRLVGLAKSKQSKTEPLRSAIVNGYAKSIMYGDYPNYQWNPEKVISKIEKWLDKKDVLDEFYAIEDENKLKEYINILNEKYGEV